MRRDTGLLTQNARLFHGTLRDNLLMGAPEAGQDEILAALAMVGADDFVRRLPRGLDHQVLEGGLGLSGGQKQSILLARLLIRQPTILLLDEPTAAMDEATERHFIKQLGLLAEDRTLVIATHRMRVLELVDRVIVIDNGLVALDDTRENALKRMQGMTKVAGEGASMSLSSTAGRGESWVYGDADETRVTRSTRVVTLAALLLLSLFTWSLFARLDEVSTGSGRVVPISREQVVQSLDGGILAVLHVGEDDVVEPGELLAQLDPTRTGANVEESAARYRAALASAARLQAEVNQSELTFPAELAAFPELQLSERELFEARRSSLVETQRWIAESLDLVRQELAISEQLTNVGAASNVEVLRLRRQAAELEQQQVDTRSEYVVRAREELAKANAEVAALSSVIKGRTDSSRA